MASISDTVKVLKALGKDVNCPVHTAPLTEFILWMQKRGLINKLGEVMDVARLQVAGKESLEEGGVGTKGVATRLETLGSVKRLLAKAREARKVWVAALTAIKGKGWPSEGEGDERGRDGVEETGGWRSGGLPGSAESL